MKTRVLLQLAAAGAMLAGGAIPSFAQDTGAQEAIGYASIFGGAVRAGGNGSGSVLFEGGVRLAPHVMAFTNVGRFSNLNADLAPSLEARTAALANEGTDVTSTGTLPAWYGIGGVRGELFPSRHVLPYVLGGIGAAHLKPGVKLAFAGGAMPDGSTPAVGTDVTSTLTRGGIFAVPDTTTEFMAMAGGGVQIPLMSRWAADIGYRYSRIAADTLLHAGGLNTNVATFGLAYRF